MKVRAGDLGPWKREESFPGDVAFVRERRSLRYTIRSFDATRWRFTIDVRIHGDWASVCSTVRDIPRWDVREAKMSANDWYRFRIANLPNQAVRVEAAMRAAKRVERDARRDREARSSARAKR